MADAQRSPQRRDRAQPNDPRSEVRLELTDAAGHQIWALTSERPDDVAPAAESPAAIFLAELPAIAWRWRRRAALGALVGVGFAIAYLALAAPVYVVRALVHIEQRDSVLQHYDAVRSGATFIGTQAEVIQSPAIIGNAFDAIGLPDKGSPGPLKRVKVWLRSLLPSDEPAPDPRAQAVMEAQASLGASPVLGTDLLAVNFRTASPQRGVDFLNALISSYRSYVAMLESEAHSEGLELLRRQDSELRAQLDDLRRSYEEVHAKAPLLGGGEGALSVQKLRLEEQARAQVEAQGRRIEIENRLKQLRARGGVALPSNDPLVDDLRAAEAQLAELRASRHDNHPDVRQTEQRIELLRQRIRKNSSEELAGVEAELRAAQETERMLANLYQREWSKAKELEQRRLSEDQLLADIAQLGLKRDAVDSLLRDKEIRVLSLQSGHSGTVVHLVDPPTIPPEKSWPQPSIVLVAFVFLGALGGLSLAVIGELRSRRNLAPVT